jgi:hypothetical protein
MTARNRGLAGLVIIIGVSGFGLPIARADPAQPPPVSSPPVADAAPIAPPPTPVARPIRLPEGTEVHIRFNEQLSSATAATGDTFSITTDEPIRLDDGTIIPAGYRGKGEVTSAEHKGMMGKAGQLNVRLDYVRIGDTHVRLRANQGEEGKSGVTSAIVLTVLFGPLGLIKHGSDVVIQKGQTLTAYVDEDASVTTPIARPPADED